MKQTVVQVTLLALLIGGLNTISKGQTQWPPLQKIRLKDKTLQRNLSIYASITDARWIRVQLDKQDSLYHYSLIEANFFECIEQSSCMPWGRWGNCILLFDSNNKAALDEILAISDSCDFSKLVSYARPLLANLCVITPLGGGLIQLETRLIHGGLDWEFVVEKGRELWIRTSDGLDSRDLPQPK